MFFNPGGPSPELVRAGVPVKELNVKAGEDIAADTQRISDSGTPQRSTAAATTVLFAGRGVLKRLVLPAALIGTLTVYDNTSAAGLVLAVLPIGYPAGSHELGFDCATGCTIVTSAADQVVGVTGK